MRKKEKGEYKHYCDICKKYIADENKRFAPDTDEYYDVALTASIEEGETRYHFHRKCLFDFLKENLK